MTNKNRTPFLGLIFNNKLSWKLQKENIKLRCTKAFNLLKMLRGKSWGSKRDTLLPPYGTHALINDEPMVHSVFEFVKCINISENSLPA